MFLKASAEEVDDDVVSGTAAIMNATLVESEMMHTHANSHASAAKLYVSLVLEHISRRLLLMLLLRLLSPSSFLFHLFHFVPQC